MWVNFLTHGFSPSFLAVVFFVVTSWRSPSSRCASSQVLFSVDFFVAFLCSELLRRAFSVDFFACSSQLDSSQCSSQSTSSRRLSRRVPQLSWVPRCVAFALGRHSRNDAIGHDNRDVAGCACESVGTTLRAGTNALQWWGPRPRKPALITRSLGFHAVVVRGVGNRTREHLAHRFARCLRSEPQHAWRVSRLHPTDEVDDAPCLHGRHADVPRLGPGFHRFPLARSS